MLEFHAFIAAQRAALKTLLGRAPAIGLLHPFEQKLLHNFHELDDLERARYYAEIRPKMTDDQRFFFEGDCRLIGQMYAAERRALYELARKRMPRTCVEIGTWSGGGSTFFISSALKANGSGRLVTFEIDELLHRSASRFYSECLPDLAPFVLFELGDASSERLKKMTLENGPIDFAFLDGAENAEQTVSHFLTIRSQFAPRAVVACHDWATTKMAKLKPLLTSQDEWQMLCELGQPESVGFAAFQLAGRGT
jgi:predicted O-methyltransferase YrrM